MLFLEKNLKVDNHSNCIKIKTRQNKELKNRRKNIVWLEDDKNTFWDFPTLKEKFSCNNAFNNKCTLKLPTNYLDNLSFWCSKIKIMNGTIFLLVGMVKDKFANFWIYSLLSPFESKDYAYTLSITHENGRSKFSHYNGQAHYMFSRIFLIRIYDFFLNNIM